jgi:peptidoglycan/LPS O-acetylase OafA/YrhL
MEAPAKAAYRRDIDGLRAVAVLAVVLFHAGVPGFSGGFVGVDVFFVLSGFLISSILIEDIERDRFSLLNFYNRRIRRIFPALFLMLGLTTLAAVALLSPQALISYGRSLAGTGFFASNFIFFLDTGYFAGNAAQQPLLHTWSLAVEEQYYVLWPLAVWLLFRPGLRRHAALICTVLAVLGLGLSVWLTGVSREAAFYLPFARLWELLLGAVLVIRPPGVLPRKVAEAMGWTGLLLIALSITLLNEAVAFPGYAVAAPCIGAALLLAANASPQVSTARLLSVAPMRGLGLVSYSFYLWHWPVLAFANYLLMRAPSWPVGLSLMIPALLMAWVSWRFVERPFRVNAAAPGARGRAILVGLLCCIAAVVVGTGLWATKGVPGRVPSDVRAKVTAASEWRDLARRCQTTHKDDVRTASDGCRFGPPGPPRILVWGDSHAAAFSPVVQTTATELGLGGLLISRASCPPMVGVGVAARPWGGDDRGCRTLADQVVGVMRDNPGLDTVVLVGRWSKYETGAGLGPDGARHTFLSGPGGDNAGIMAAGLTASVAAIRQALGEDVRIIIVGQPPEPGFDAGECIAFRRMLRLSASACESIDRTLNADRRARSDAVLAELAPRLKVEILPLMNGLCDERTCRTWRDGTLLYRDDDHLSPAGAMLFANDLKVLLERPR